MCIVIATSNIIDMTIKKRIGIVLLIGLGVWVSACILNGINASTPTVVTSMPTPTPEPPLLDQINAVRAKDGKGPLTEDSRLSAAAKEKAQDMINRGYREHRASETKHFLNDRLAGKYNGSENLAWCQVKDSERVEDWIDSPGHYSTMTGDFALWGSATIHNDKDGCDYTVNYFVKPL